jgi:hypothetical protein
MELTPDDAPQRDFGSFRGIRRNANHDGEGDLETSSANEPPPLIFMAGLLDVMASIAAPTPERRSWNSRCPLIG